jgi:hypothetical protein
MFPIYIHLKIMFHMFVVSRYIILIIINIIIMMQS